LELRLKMKDKIKIIGVTISLTWLSLITLVIFMKGLGVLLNTWFSNNALWITLISGVLVLIFVIIGVISIGTLSSKSKSIF